MNPLNLLAALPKSIEGYKTYAVILCLFAVAIGQQMGYLDEETATKFKTWLMAGGLYTVYDKIARVHQDMNEDIEKTEIATED